MTKAGAVAGEERSHSSLVDVELLSKCNLNNINALVVQLCIRRTRQRRATVPAYVPDARCGERTIPEIN